MSAVLNRQRYNNLLLFNCMGWQEKWNLEGQRFGRLLVLDRTESIKGQSTWACQCDCGTLKNVRGIALRAGQTISCGCYARENRIKHGRKINRLDGKIDPTYSSYINMKTRILNPNANNYKNYGGRGIKICHQWLDGGFDQFLSDMGERPEGKTLDRIDHNGDYSPENCKWSTAQEQSENKRNSILLTHNGQTKCLTVWARELSVSRKAIYTLIRKGKSLDELFTNNPIAK